MGPFKLIRLLKRPDGHSPEAFRAAWRDEAQGAALTISGLVGYVQNFCLPGAYRTRTPLFDGYAEEYYASHDARAARCLGADAPMAMEARAQQMLLLPVSAIVVKPGATPTDAIKSVELIRRREDMTMEDFGRYWRERHGPLACTLPFLRYEQNHLAICGGSAGDVPFDGAAITWFPDTDSMRATASLPAYRSVRADEANFLQGTSPVLLTTAHIVRPPPDPGPL